MKATKHERLLFLMDEDLPPVVETRAERCQRILAGGLAKHLKPASEMYFSEAAIAAANAQVAREAAFDGGRVASCPPRT